MPIINFLLLLCPVVLFINPSFTQCPEAVITIQDPNGLTLCSDSESFLINMTVSGLSDTPVITWSGSGIIDPTGIYDPASGVIGKNIVTVSIEDSGCVYADTIKVYIRETPTAAIEINGTQCIDSTLELIFSGHAYVLRPVYHWDFSGGDYFRINWPLHDYAVKWETPGSYEISLWIDDLGCTSDTFIMPLQIDAPLEIPRIDCLVEDNYSIVISWEPIIGATEYIVSSTLGTGKLSGTTYTISELPDETLVSITVTAIGSACGSTSSTIECRTTEYIASAAFISNIFSPNNDGINDMFFIQTNSQVTSVHAFRIFDRWGSIVFEQFQFNSNDPARGWDGSYSGKDMNPGVYLYWAQIETKDEPVVVMTGDVTLIR